MKPNEKFSLEDSALDNFKAQGFPDHKILDHLKVDYFKFEEKLKKALKQTQFKELQKIEKIEGFKEKGFGKYFFRKGKIGVWNGEVSTDIIKQLEKFFGKEMVELGYL